MNHHKEEIALSFSFSPDLISVLHLRANRSLLDFLVDVRPGRCFQVVLNKYYSKGKSMTKALLKSPLRYRGISSYFSSRRFHPVLRIHRPHYGVDYAAPTRTPLESVGGDARPLLGGMGAMGAP